MTDPAEDGLERLLTSWGQGILDEDKEGFAGGEVEPAAEDADELPNSHLPGNQVPGDKIRESDLSGDEPTDFLLCFTLGLT